MREREKKKYKCKNCGCPTQNKKFCSNQCQQDFKYKEFIKKWKNKEIAGTRSGLRLKSSVRRYIFEKFDNKCCRCGFNEKNPYTGNYILEIDHIDGNAENSWEDNLRLLCPNCHAMTENYKALNKNASKKRLEYFFKGPKH